MGLDMYLLRKDLCKQRVEDGRIVFSFYDEDNDWEEIPGAQAVYWRKANHIHKWFVDNVQNGQDDCGQYPVQSIQLAKLVEVCKQVLEIPEDAPHVLPRQQGFFFGSDDYDEWYIQQTQETVNKLEKVMREAPENAEFLYESSW